MPTPRALSEFARDVALALRQLRKQPAFSAATVTTLALGIGATTTLFSVLNAVVLHPLPFRESDRLVDIATTYRNEPGAISVGDYFVIREHTRTLESVAARAGATFNLAEEGEPERVRGTRVTASYFQVLGAQARLGRVFSAGEDRPGESKVAVLSDRLFKRRFGGDPQILGREVRLSGVPHLVIGVMNENFRIPEDETDIWTPIAFKPGERSFDAHYLGVIGRLKSGVTREQFRADVQAIGRAAREAAPRENEGREFVGSTLLDLIVGDYRQRLLILLGAVSLVFLISCVNVASLLMARGASRVREIAVRAALGASRARLARQLMTEALVLCALGGVAGCALAFAALPIFIAQSPTDVPRLAEARIDTPALIVASLISLIAAMIAGLAPAFRSSRTDLAAAASRGSRGSTGSVGDRWRQAFVAAEVALSLMLLMGAGLLIRSNENLNRVSPGFDPDNLMSARIALPTTAFPGEVEPAAAVSRMVDTLAHRPGVAEAAASTRPPLIGDVGYGLRIEDRGPDPKNRLEGRMQLVTPGYLETLRVALRAGRTFTAHDRRDAPRVMIVSETLARSAWPGENPIGKRVACCEGSDDHPAWKEIVGVVADTRARGLSAPGLNEFYLPMDQAPSRSFEANGGSITLVARAANGRPETLAQGFREAVKAEDSTLPLYDVATMSSRVAASTAVPRFHRLLLGCLGLLGLTLAVVGIYGVIAYLASQRLREMSVRMALGATAGNVMSLVMRQGLRAVAIGLFAGIAGVLAQARALEAITFGVSSRDPATLVTACLTLLLAAAGASLLPAWRAARTDPARILAEP